MKRSAGVQCPDCKGTGMIVVPHLRIRCTCERCMGLGSLPRRSNQTDES